jgi:hypothetical protein
MRRQQWKLKRPDVIISVTGGAEDFDLSTEEKDRIFKAMMDGTRSLDAWFTTGGTNAGVMKCMGEFRTKYNPTAPLIGVASLGVISASETLRGIHISACTGGVGDKNAKAGGEKSAGEGGAGEKGEAGSKQSEKGDASQVKAGWQKLGYDHAKFPSLNSVCEEKTGPAAEIRRMQERREILKRFKDRGQASDKVRASALAFVECICAVCGVFVCNSSFLSTLPGNVISVVGIVGFSSAVSDCTDSRGQ